MPPETVASLQAVLKADASQLKRELDQSKGKLEQFKSNVESQVQPLRTMDSTIRTLGMAFGVATAAAYAAKKAFDFAKEGAELEFVVGKFDRLAKSIGTTGTALERDLRIATRGTISDMELIAGATDFMALGLAKTHDEAVRLTRISAALGMNMNQLVLTLTNQTTMRFDALGIAVDGFDEKVKKLEASGMRADLAFKFAFMEQAEEQIARLGERADAAAGSFDRLDASWKNFMDTAKQSLGQLAPLVDYLAANAKIQFAFSIGALDPLTKKFLEGQLALGLVGMQMEGMSAIEIFERLNKLIADFDAKEVRIDIVSDFGKEEFLQRIRSDFAELGTEAATIFSDSYKANMSALDTMVSGPLGGENESFLQQQEELINKAAELRARIQEASTFPPNLAQQQELFNLRSELELTNQAIRQNATEHEMATKRILFSLLTQRIAQMELSETTRGVAYQMAYDMAAAWGLIDEQTHQALMSIDKGLGLLAQGNIKGAQSEIVRLGQLAASVSGDYYINFIVTTTTVESISGGRIKKGDQSAAVNRTNLPKVNIPPGGFYPGGFGGGGGGGGGGAGAVAAPAKTMLQKLLETASALSQVGASAISMLQSKIDPLKQELEGLNDLIRPGHVDIYAIDHMTEMTERRAMLANEIAEAEEKILRLQEQQQKLRYLESQVRLLELIKENNLNAKNILGGLKLGINAEMGDIIEATTKARAELIEKIQKKLKIGSPSRVFWDIGRDMMQGWGQGIEFNAREVKGAMDSALQLTTAAGAGGFGYSDGAAPQEININFPIESITSMLDVETIAYRVAEIMNYRNR